MCRVAKTVEQAAELIEASFEYVCEIDGVNCLEKGSENAEVLCRQWCGRRDLNPGPQRGRLTS